MAEDTVAQIKEKTRYCIDCKHCLTYERKGHYTAYDYRCAKYKTTDSVRGKSQEGDCDELRQINGLCSMNGTGWEFKKSEHEPYTLGPTYKTAEMHFQSILEKGYPRDLLLTFVELIKMETKRL